MVHLADSCGTRITHSGKIRFGAVGRVYLGGEEQDVEVGWQAAVGALEGLSGRDVS